MTNTTQRGAAVLLCRLDEDCASASLPCEMPGDVDYFDGNASAVDCLPIVSCSWPYVMEANHNCTVTSADYIGLPYDLWCTFLVVSGTAVGGE